MGLNSAFKGLISLPSLKMEDLPFSARLYCACDYPSMSYTQPDRAFLFVFSFMSKDNILGIFKKNIVFILSNY